MAEKRVQRRLAAILAADVVGYSRLIRTDEEGTLAALKSLLEDIVDPKIAENHGRIVKLMGDGVLAEFPSVVDAVRTAAEVQRAVAERNADRSEEQPIVFRIGINLGDVVIDGDDIQGDGVNLASRLEGLAEPGGMCISAAVYDQVRDRIELSFEDLGEQEVKNIDRPIRVWRWAKDASVSAERPATADQSLPLPDKPSIAVLAFDNLSGDAEQEYFADGIAEDLITALSRIRWLFVAARNSTFTYKRKAIDVKQVGREMGVRYVVEGSVRKAGNRVRISAQLVDATTGSHIWARRYDRNLDDILAIQDELTEAIAGEIEPELAQVERERAHRKPPENLDAWDLYQRGLWHMWQFTADENAKALQLFQRATDVDDRFAPAFAALAYSYFSNVVFAYRNTVADDLASAQQAALTAVAIDDRDAMAHCTLGRVHTALGDLASAIAELEKAVDLNPSFALARYGLAVALMFSGEAGAGKAQFDDAARLSPHDPYLWLFENGAAMALIVMGRFFEAEVYALRATRHPTAGFWPYAALAGALAEQGKLEEAYSALSKLLEMKPEFGPAFFERLWPNTDRAFFKVYFAALRKAGLEMPDEPTVMD